MPAAGIEPAIPARERPQTHDLCQPATGVGSPGVNVGYLEVCCLSMLSVATVM